MAQTYKFGNGTWATKEGSTLAYSDTNNAFKPLPFSFERNSIGTRVNKEGLIEVVGNDIPRIDYKDSADGVLLLEPSRSNSVINSEPTSNEGSASGITYESFNWVIGFTNCVKFGDNSAITYRYGGTVSASTEYTLSVFIIMDDLSEPFITNSSVGGDFSLNIGNTIASGTNNPNVSMGNNIWRVSKTSVANVTSSNNGIIKYTTQSSKGFRVVGLQIEQGSYATSYIPTNGSTVQRAAETANGSGNSEVFNDSEGVLFADIAALTEIDTFRAISISSGSDNNRINIWYWNNGTFKIDSNSGANVQSNFDFDANMTLFNKIAFKYKQNDFCVFHNGFKIGIDTSGITPVGLSELSFDRANGAYPFYGKTKEIGYYDTVLTDAELETLTSYRSLSELVTELNLNTL